MDFDDDLREYNETLRIGGKHFIHFKLDPGSEVNIIPRELYCVINEHNSYVLSNKRTALISCGKEQLGFWLKRNMESPR